MQWKCFLGFFLCGGGFNLVSLQRGTLQLIVIHLITLDHIVEYVQIAIIKTETADFIKINICVILKSFGHGCICLTIFPSKKKKTVHLYYTFFCTLLDGLN